MIEAETYEKVRNILTKLPKETVKNGTRTFEIHGMKQYIGYHSCFVAMMYGNPGAYCRRFVNTWNTTETPFPEITDAERICLSGTHYTDPEILFLAACEVLDS